MKFSRTTAPNDLPITVEEAKAHCAIEHTDDDAIIGIYIAQAVDYAENYTGRQLMDQVWTAYYDSWHTVFALPFRPLKSVVIKYTDPAGDEQILSADQYMVDDQEYPALVSAETWPETKATYNAIRVEATCGYVDASDVPAGIKSAMYLLTGHLYENREGSAAVKISELPLGVDSFLRQYKVDF